MFKKVIALLTAVGVFAAAFWAVQRLLVPKYKESLFEGSLIEEYYDETTGHDVIFVGDCEVYENFSPVTLWEEYGVTSYIRGSANQLMWQSYYLMEETLRYETPQVMVFNVLPMMYDTPINEAYNRMTLDGMRLSSSKIASIRASMTEEESFISYIFPLLRYHSRWSQLEREDVDYFFGERQVSHNGYLMRVDVKPLETLPTPRPLGDYSFSDICWEYLDKMRVLCDGAGVELVLIKAPSAYPHWYDEWDAQIKNYADAWGLTYINFTPLDSETGIDMTTDTYDNGLHLNLSGAEKLSRYFGNILIRDFGVADRRGDAALEAVWTEKVSYYYWMKEDQLRELEEFGYLKSYGGRPV